MVTLLRRGVITPAETAGITLDTLASEQAYQSVPEVAEMLPAEVHEQLKPRVEEILKPNASLRTFDGLRFPTEEAKAKYDRQIHSQFVRIAVSLRECWQRMNPQS